MQVEPSRGEIAYSSGVSLRREGQRLYFVDVGAGWMVIVIFICALLGFIAGVNGVVQGALALSGSGSLIAAIILLPVSVACLLAIPPLLRRKKQRRSASSAELTVLAIVDLEQGLLLDARGQALAPLSQVQFKRRFQAASSSPALAAVWPGGSRVLVHGTPFDGGIADVGYQLERLGLMR